MSSPTLNIEANILPLKLHLELLIRESLLQSVISVKYLQFTQIKSKYRLYIVTLLKAFIAQFEPQ